MHLFLRNIFLVDVVLIMSTGVKQYQNASGVMASCKLLVVNKSGPK
jgi:hypothetical protein